MNTLEISLRYAIKASEALEDNRNLSEHLTQTSSNTYILNPDEGGFMDKEQLEDEITYQLTSAGVPEDEFWFNS